MLFAVFKSLAKHFFFGLVHVNIGKSKKSSSSNILFYFTFQKDICIYVHTSSCRRHVAPSWASTAALLLPVLMRKKALFINFPGHFAGSTTMSRHKVQKGATVTSAQSSHEFWAVQNCRSSCFLRRVPVLCRTSVATIAAAIEILCAG